MTTRTLSQQKHAVLTTTTSKTLGVTFFVLAMALSSYVRIPLWGSPVPITLQTMFVLLSGVVLGVRLAVLTQGIYILLGICGIQVFAGYSYGMSYLLGPTAGYLAGFAVAGALLGKLSSYSWFKGSKMLGLFIGADVLIHALGMMWLMYGFKMTVSTAFMVGVAPFFFGEAIKILAVTKIYSLIKRNK
jgi:biotin transport system substrate-specific component